MRSHGRILVTIWADPDWIKLPETAQRLYMLLLAQKHINNAGVQPLMIGQWAKMSAQSTQVSVRYALDILQGAAFIVYDIDTAEVLVRSFIRNDGVLSQPNVLKNALRVAEQTESPRLRQVLADELASLGRDDATAVADRIRPAEPISNPFETHREGFPEGFQEPLAFPQVAEGFQEGFQEGFPKPRGDGEGVTTSSSLTSSCGCASNARENETTTVIVQPTVQPASGQIPIPADWAPNDVHRARWPRPDLDDLADAFRDHATSTGRTCHGRAGWNAAFSTWVRKSKPAAANSSTTDARILAAQALKDPERRNLA